MKRVLLWVFGLMLLAVMLAGAALGIGGWLSLDEEFSYSRSVDRLPLFPEVDPLNLTAIEAGGFTFRARVSGFGNEGPAVILLHGFPETSAMWLPLIDAAASRGYRVLAFDQRGYSPGARPADVSDYAVPRLVQDVLRVADAAGIRAFHLVGHDWGSIVGWSVVMSNPERVLSWTGLSVPHPAAFGEAVQNDPEQQKKSSYFLLFQQPWLPEKLFAFNNQMLLRDVFYETMPRDQRQEYLAMLAEPGAMTAALNWYRALETEEGQSPESPVIDRPALFIWGNEDPAVSAYAVQAQRKYIRGPFKELELNAGHWLMEEQAAVVVPAVLEHLDAYSPEGR